jgi:diguanylate cyclase (GGDEF)-like protein
MTAALASISQRAWLLGPAIVTLLAFTAVMSLNLWHVVEAVDARSLERERSLIESAVDLRLASLEATVDDNSFWDDAAIAMRQPALDESFVEGNWGNQTAGSIAYSGAFVSDAEERSLIGFIRGERVPDAALTAISAFKPKLRNRLNTGRATASGLITHRGIALMVATGKFTTNTPGTLAPDAPERSLTLTLRLTDEVVARMNEALKIDSLGLRRAGPGEAELALSDLDGRPVATIAWKPARPGFSAVREQAGTALLSIVLFTVVIAFIARSSLRAADQLTTAALSDALSGLPNRRAFRTWVARMLLRNEKIGVAMLDLDGFKAINDIYGHAVGDRLLLIASRELEALAGDHVMVARLGGDEFALATSGPDAEQLIEAIAAGFIERTTRPFKVDDRTLTVGASVGLAVDSLAGADVGELLRRADVALYAAKRAGKGRARWYDGDIDRRQAAAHALADELRAGLAQGSFHLVYQPIVADAEGTIVCAEALLRFDSPSSGPVPPDVFIPVAEETGLIDQIGLHVIRQACTDAARWGDLPVSVNVSAAQLRNPELPQAISAILADTGFDPKRLELEVTETYLISDPDVSQQVLRRISELGVSLSLDDFGTGYASIGFLRRFHFDKLKIDRSLVADAERGGATDALLTASIALARALSMRVVAEGVETSSQVDYMLSLGCDMLQGWHFAKAMPPVEFERRLAANPKIDKRATVD